MGCEGMEPGVKIAGDVRLDVDPDVDLLVENQG